MAPPKKRSKIVHFSQFEFALLQYLAEVASDSMVGVIRRSLYVYAQQFPGFELAELERRVAKEVMPALGKEKDRFRLQADLREFTREFDTSAEAVLADPRLSESEGEVEFNSDRDF